MKLSTIVGTLLMAAGVQLAGAQGFVSNLDAAQDGGGGRTGIGQVYLYLTGSTLTFSNGNYSGLSGTVSAAHIHGPAGPGVSAGVIYGLIPTFITSGANSGTINGGNLSLVDGTAGITLANQLTQLNSGLWYINIHSTTFGGGEIRGQIVVVPEPTTAALILMGAGCAGLMLRRNRRQN
jgi:hypothetical protein